MAPRESILPGFFCTNVTYFGHGKCDNNYSEQAEGRRAGKETRMRTLNTDHEYTENSRHSYVRAKERAGLSRKRAERLMELARYRGIGYEDCKWRLDKDYLMNRTGDGAKAVAYNGYCFILNSETLECITMYSLPKHFGKKKTFYAISDRHYTYVYEKPKCKKHLCS